MYSKLGPNLFCQWNVQESKAPVNMQNITVHIGIMN